LATRKLRTGGAGWPPQPLLDAIAETDWEDEVRGLIKSTMKRQRLTYADLAQKLGRIGIQENAANLRNKINRGNFSAAFFLQCIAALECALIRVGPEWHLTTDQQ
jgi:Domain of unknown function (DUF6471)